MDEPSRCIRIALLITGLFILMSFQPFFITSSNTSLNRIDETNFFTSENYTQQLTIASHPNGVSSALKLEVPAGEALTGVDLSLEPTMLARNEIFTWSNEQVWNHSDAIPESVNYNNTGLTMSGADVGWDFDSLSGTLPTGWSSTSSTFGLVNDNTLGTTTSAPYGYLSCGTNGSSGGSLMLRNGAVTVTSDTIDMSALSQGTISFWMTEGRINCGEDPDTTEHLYLEYKNSAGGWSQVTYFNAALGNPGYTNVNSQFNLPANALHSNFQFRFRIPGASGSCCDWWFIDDIKVTTPGGAGNWTSPAFGWGGGATYSMVEGPYGLLSMDVERPGTSQFNWTVLDGTTLQPIPGFENLDDTVADLGSIDWQTYPTLRLKIRMSGGGGGLPVLNSINLNGRIAESFHDDPASNGWVLQGATWSSGSDSIAGGNGASLISPYYNSSRPISMISTTFSLSGLGQLYVELNGDNWIPIGASSTQSLTEAGHSIRFIFNGTGSWTIQDIVADLIPGDYPLNPRLDIAQDQEIEWAIDEPAVGPWGWQDRLSNGYQSGDLSFTNGGTKSVMLWLPDTGVDNFQWSIASVYGATNATWWRLKMGPTIIDEGGLGLFTGRTTVSLDNSSLAKLNDNLTSSVSIWSTAGVSFVLVEIVVGCESGMLRVGGISAPYSPVADISFGAWDSVVQAVNNEIPTSAYIDGKRVVPLPFIMSLPGSMYATITGVYSTSGLQTTSASLVNSTSTLTPSWQWLELHSTHQTTIGPPGKVQVDFIGLNNRTTFEFPVDGGEPIAKYDSNLIRWHPENAHSVTYDSESVNSTLRFQIEPMWDDEESFEIRVRLVLADGRRSIPEVATFGGGQGLGIENDIEIRSLDFVNDLGIVIPSTASYLRGARNVTVEAEIGFHNIPGNFAPRSGDILIELFENGVEIHNTTVLNLGHYSHTYLVPPGSNEITYGVEITPLRGGWDYTSIDTERTFQTDSLAPLVVASNIKHYDHRTHSPTQELRFDVYDRPVLPQSLTLMLWREWLNDYDFDEWPDEEEYVAFTLTSPSDLSLAQANYTYMFDDNNGEYGDKVAGYVTGADPAGNPILDGGGPGPDNHLFMYELALEGTPLIVPESATVDGDKQAWLHPGNTYDLVIPFNEPNGFSDVDEIILELASNAQSDNLPITWMSVDNRCTTSSPQLTIVECSIRASEGALGPYVDDMQMEVSFIIDWALLTEGELRREPTIEIFDSSRQSTFSAIPHLRWRWSTDLHVPVDMLSLAVEDGVITSEGAWAAPGSTISIHGNTIYAASGQSPEFGLQVKFTIGGEDIIVGSENGTFFVEIEAPLDSGSHALSWELIYLPPQANDVTDGATAIYWIVVDGDSPYPVEIVTPREGKTIPLSDLGQVLIDLRIAETQEIDPSTLQLQWVVTNGDDPKGPMVAEGFSDLAIPSGSLASLQLSASTTLNLEEQLEDESLESALTLHVWVTGQDAAGNLFTSNRSFNSDDAPFASWHIEQKVASWKVETNDINYQRIFIEVGESMVVQIDVNNVGTTSGIADVLVESVNLAGERQTLQIATAEAEPGQSETLAVSWKTSEIGIQWIEVTINGDTTVKGEEIDVLKNSENSVFSGALGGVDPVILGAFFALLGVLAVVLLMFLRDTNSRREKEWEGDYWDDDEEEHEEETVVSDTETIVKKAAEYDQIYSSEGQESSANDPYGDVAKVATESEATQSGGPDWVQDANGHWWKKNDEGYWWRLGEDGQWYAADESGYA